jgi:DNA-binding PadR family transcriptional regulator
VKKKTSKETRASARAAILCALCLGPAYGGLIVERIEKATGGQVKLTDGGLYPGLRTLQDDKFIRPCDGPPREHGGRERQYFELTATGRREAEICASVFHILAKLVEKASGERVEAMSKALGCCIPSVDESSSVSKPVRSAPVAKVAKKAATKTKPAKAPTVKAKPKGKPAVKKAAVKAPVAKGKAKKTVKVATPTKAKRAPVPKAKTPVAPASVREHAAVMRDVVRERGPIAQNEIFKLAESILGKRYDSDDAGTAFDELLEAEAFRQNTSGDFELNESDGSVVSTAKPAAPAAPAKRKHRKEKPETAPTAELPPFLFTAEREKVLRTLEIAPGSAYSIGNRLGWEADHTAAVLKGMVPYGLVVFNGGWMITDPGRALVPPAGNQEAPAAADAPLPAEGPPVVPVVDAGAAPAPSTKTPLPRPARPRRPPTPKAAKPARAPKVESKPTNSLIIDDISFVESDEPPVASRPRAVEPVADVDGEQERPPPSVPSIAAEAIEPCPEADEPSVQQWWEPVQE